MSEDRMATDNSAVYSDSDSMESFDDLGDDFFPDDEGKATSATSDGNSDDDEDEDNEGDPTKDIKAKKDAAKKARGQKGDDLEILDIPVEEVEEGTEKKKTKEKEEDLPEDEEVEDREEKPKEEKSQKGKPTFVTVDGETYSLDSNAIISTQVDGKTEKVTLQELKNNYAGKVSWNQKFNEINVKEHGIKRERKEIDDKVERFTGLQKSIESIMQDDTKDPEDAFEVFLDALGVDSYTYKERSFKARLQELSSVLGMEDAERRAYFLEKKNGHLVKLSEKRESSRLEESKRNSYRQKADELRRSSNVTEAQYVDAHEELTGMGFADKDLSERQIVDWAASKPHFGTVRGLLDPYKDQFDGGTFDKLTWELSQFLRTGTDTPEGLKKAIAEAYGVPSEVKALSQKLNPLGRKPSRPAPAPSKSKNKYDSFDDFEED